MCLSKGSINLRGRGNGDGPTSVFGKPELELSAGGDLPQVPQRLPFGRWGGRGARDTHSLRELRLQPAGGLGGEVHVHGAAALLPAEQSLVKGAWGRARCHRVQVGAATYSTGAPWLTRSATVSFSNSKL